MQPLPPTRRPQSFRGMPHNVALCEFEKYWNLLGEGARISGLSYGNREPNDRPPPADPYGGAPGEELVLSRAWHREDSGNIEGAAANECFCPAVQVIYYLDEVDRTNHCTSVIPESAATKRARPRRGTRSSATGATTAACCASTTTGRLGPRGTSRAAAPTPPSSAGRLPQRGAAGVGGRQRQRGRAPRRRR